MALDFPTSPTDGQIYNNYYWDNTNSVWRLLGDSLEIAAAFSNTPTGSYTDGFDYEYVSFTSDGTLTVTRGGYCDILVVGGGGAGALGGGGGGAGGMLYVENAFIPAGSLDVVVGAGGLGVTSPVNFVARPGDNGEASSLWKYFAPGGGGGGSRLYVYNTNTLYSSEGLNGGSGGGGAGGATSSSPGLTGGVAVTGLGNNGGDGAMSYGAGGGGGAGAVGQDGGNTTGGDGGAGLSNSITGSAVTYAGGGGGGASTPGSAGSGGGGAGGTGSGSDATANTGGGGGGCDQTASGNKGGNGGSGIVIVRVRTN